MRVSTRPLLQLCVVGACAALLSPFAGAQEGVADSEALTALKALADKPGLMLGTGADSASEHFGIA